MNQLPVFLLFLSIATFGNDTSSFRDTTHAKSSHHKMTVAEVLAKYTDTWMKIPGVTGTGEGKSDGKPCIMVFIERKSEAIKKKIPKEAGGYKVVLKETGKIQAQ
jgi:hypothetical protein